MMWHVVIPGIVYEGETNEQAMERERRQIEHNRRCDEMRADFERQRKTPMPSMIAWARARNLCP